MTSPSSAATPTTAPDGSSLDEFSRGPAASRGSRMRAILPESPLAPYDPDMDDMTLPPELERFAAEAIAAGRYRDKAELLAAGVSLLQRQERARAELLASVLAAKVDGDRDGYLTGDEVAARVRARVARRSATPA